MKGFAPVLICATLGLSVLAGYRVRTLKDARGHTSTAEAGSLLASLDKQYSIAESDYYRGISKLLKDNFVEEVGDENKLLDGAVRGMITGLRDIDSQFYEKDQFESFKAVRNNIYHGVGVWLEFKAVKSAVKLDGEDGELLLPRLSVVSVGAGTSADKAGVKVGDMVDSIDGHWVVNSDAVLAFRKLQSDFLAKKVDFKTYNDARKIIRDKAEKSITPMRAKERLTVGTQGSLQVEWLRDGKVIPTTLVAAKVETPTLVERNGAFLLNFVAGAPAALSSYIQGKSEVTLDLRNNIFGDQETMRKCLAVIGPAGTYGMFENQRKSTPTLLTIQTGNPKPPKVKLLVDVSTRDAAEMFALALTSKGIATLSGTEMGNSRKLREITQLPDGSGYTMVIGTFKAGEAKGVAK